MVLALRPTSQGIRFLVGIFIIAVSIYLFYLALARNNSPELFLVPEIVTPPDYPCAQALIEGHRACIPSEFSSAQGSSGIEVFSAPARIRGTIQVLSDLPQEAPWRKSLERPLIQAFLGDIDSMDTFELMKSILKHRFNPTLMGIKANLIPSWMKNNPQAEIIMPQSRQAIVFYTPTQFLGMVFSAEDVVILSFVGPLDRDLAAGMTGSVEIR